MYAGDQDCPKPPSYETIWAVIGAPFRVYLRIYEEELRMFGVLDSAREIETDANKEWINYVHVGKHLNIRRVLDVYF